MSNGETVNLPSVAGWDGESETRSIVQGRIIKCVDGIWTHADDGTRVPESARLLAIGTLVTLTHWQNQKPVEELVGSPGQPLPSIDDLNDQIPQEEWEMGLDGKPRAPWVKNFVVYLVDEDSADKYTFKNSTAGAMRAVAELKDRVSTKSYLVGGPALPVVQLSSREMQTRFGRKIRPHFKVIDWRNAGAPAAPAIEHRPTVSEELNDQIPF
jgi:hypothetical protein